MRGELPKREGVMQMNVNGTSCWARYEHNVVFGKDWETWKIELPGRVIASIIRKPGSYGYEGGLYEIAFLDDDGLIPFETLTGCCGVDNEVAGFLTEEDVIDFLCRAINSLLAKLT